MYRSIVLCCVLMIPSLAWGQEAKATRPAITGISHMTLFADDLAKSQQFYTSLLGWEQVPAGKAQPGERFYMNHLQYIELVPAPGKGLADRFDRLGFLTSDAEQMRRYLGANGVSVPRAVTVDMEGDKSFEVKDPEGNRIDFTQAAPDAPKGGKSVTARVSTHIIHAGFVVRDRAKEDEFYKKILGFHLYWQGGSGLGRTDWVMMQAPDGTDWLEYMLGLPASPSRGQLASANHFSPGVVSITELDKRLKQNGWVPSSGEGSSLLGVDGKWQLDLHDPDGTRVEFMEFKPVKTPCCSAFTGPEPGPSTTW